MSEPQERCYMCLTEDVAVQVLDLCGFAHWLCAECGESNQRLRDWLYGVVPDGAS